MREKIQEVIVVEGRDDTTRLQEVYDVDTIETNGSAVSKQTLERVRRAQETRGVIILTDPDYPGDRIRAIVDEYVPGCKHAYLPRAEAKDKRGKIGVEHATPDTIRRVLEAVYEDRVETDLPLVTRKMVLDADLIGGAEASRRRKRLGVLLRIGEPNAKQFVKRVEAMRVTTEEWERALKQLEEENH
ncbi:MAG: ribonuclease M5 [Exiguobacterium sp.]|uniref:Ribonuclease M5 n=1 Tax=Exiguobacterium alkaliphilum TaxID=1428684 RepID=A0ABT2KY48_9BACL|nr:MULTISPECIES: ribonuclease M5 [Exiguobacterium]MDX5322459.1 ribonuclease M5 [Exiguobacterium sp.]KDN59653.1 ribonuclease M5 [Exiguobacterium sp. AB2]MCT4795862.1 ribonuclease M5 [Exiguobacterium alkaliphilum]MDX5424184.1 ribonuclease M5 [Exiguobacterium sp.]MDX6771703.1 ribonuclease M5 [Exiguobacterium sp.]